MKSGEFVDIVSDISFLTISKEVQPIYFSHIPRTAGQEGQSYNDKKERKKDREPKISRVSSSRCFFYLVRGYQTRRLDRCKNLGTRYSPVEVIVVTIS